jgi:hypothetical protein
MSLENDRLAAAVDAWLEYDYGPEIETGDNPGHWEKVGEDTYRKEVFLIQRGDGPSWTEDFVVRFVPGKATIAEDYRGPIRKVYETPKEN